MRLENAGTTAVKRMPTTATVTISSINEKPGDRPPTPQKA
jgi:hypothetical protein